MIHIELDSSKQGIELYLDETGINELISFLTYVKDSKEHLHLLIGNELSEEMFQKHNSLIAHALIVLLESEIAQKQGRKL